MTSSEYIFIPITRACNVFKECGPMITSILRTFLQFTVDFTKLWPRQLRARLVGNLGTINKIIKLIGNRPIKFGSFASNYRNSL